MASDLYLTNSSSVYQRVSPNAWGLSIRLPACNAYAAPVLGAFELVNETSQGLFPVRVCDSTGNLLGWLRAGERCVVDVHSVTVPSDCFTLRFGDRGADQGISFFGTNGTYTTSVTTYAMSQAAHTACMFENSNYGAMLTQDGTTIRCTIFAVTEQGLEFSTTNLDVGAACTGGSDLGQAHKMMALNANQIILTYTNVASTQSWVLVVQLSGFGAYLGTPLGVGNNGGVTNCLAKTSSTSFLCMNYSAGNPTMSGYTVSGTTITQSGSQPTVLTGGCTPYGIAVLSPTLAMVQGSSARYNWVPLSGGVVSGAAGTVTYIPGRSDGLQSYRSNHITPINSTQALAVHTYTSAYPGYIYAAIITYGSPSVSISEFLIMQPPGSVSTTSLSPVSAIWLHDVYSCGNGTLLLTFLSSTQSGSVVGTEIYYAMLRIKNGKPVLGGLIRHPMAGTYNEYNFIGGTLNHVVNVQNNVGLCMSGSNMIQNTTSYGIMEMVPILVA